MNNFSKSPEKFNFTRRDHLEIALNLLIEAGKVSFLFLILLFGYQRLLIFLTDSLGWTIKTNLQNNPIAYTLYNQSTQIIIVAYVVFLIINVTSRYNHERNKLVLSYIRRYISFMAKGNYHLKIPVDNIGDYGSLSQDVNTLMESINQAFDQRDQTEKTKDELMNNIGHDIRTPLTSILGYLRLIKDSKDLDQECLTEYLDVVYHKAKSMQVLINDLFEYTSSQVTTSQLQLDHVPMKAFVDQVLAEHSLQADKQRIQLISQVNPQELVVEMDPDKMVRVFNNFITNAFKYAEGATYLKVIIKEVSEEEYQAMPHPVEPIQKIPAQSWVVAEFRNNGPLLEEEDLDKVYERSYRADVSRTSQKPGSGLGLAIVRNIVNLHHGSSYAKVEDHDLVFVVCLPREQILHGM